MRDAIAEGVDSVVVHLEGLVLAAFLRLGVPHVALDFDDEVCAPRGDVEAGLGPAEEGGDAADAVGDFVVRCADVEPTVPELGDELNGFAV